MVTSADRPAPDEVDDRTLDDDRILPLTRAVALVVVGILVLAWVVLFLYPGQTDHRFAWTIDSRMTAMLMGAGYGSAIYFFGRVLTERRWHRVSLGFLPTTVFTWMMLGATLLHWDRFRHGSAPFRLWFWVYLATPILVPAIWLLNRPHDPRALEKRDAMFLGWTRIAMAVAGASMGAVAAWLFVAPGSAASVWPWPLTPLTSRAVAAFVALPAVAWLAMASDRRWSAARVMLTTVALGLVLLLIAVARAWNEFDPTNPIRLVYLGGLVGTLAAIGVLALWMRLRTRAFPRPT
jgi:peptidoglycan/LPS O-acetylase OafA/YrhL